MNRAKFAAAVLVVGSVVALGLFAYLLDHGRAYGRVIPGLGDAADPEREEARAVSSDEDGEDAFESGRRAPPLLDEPAGLEVRVVDPDGRRSSFMEVVVYRGEELLRAGAATFGTAKLIPFEGPGSLRVVRD